MPKTKSIIAGLRVFGRHCDHCWLISHHGENQTSDLSLKCCCSFKSLNLCLALRPQDDLSPVREAGEFDPVVRPLSALQQAVKRQGELGQHQCAGYLHH